MIAVCCLFVVAEPGYQSGQAGSGTATAVILAILLTVVLAVAVIGGVYYVRRRNMEKAVPSVQYNKETDDVNDIKDHSSLARDLSISNPNYATAVLQSNA